MFPADGFSDKFNYIRRKICQLKRPGKVGTIHFELFSDFTHRYGKIFPLAKLSPDERECKLRGTLEIAVNGQWHPLTSFCGRKLEILEEWSRECIEYIRENNLTEE